MLKRTLCMSIIIAILMTILPMNMFVANAAATGIDYVSIDKSQGLNIGAVLEAKPVFEGTIDGTEVVTYQWVRTKIETKNHSNGSANDKRYMAISGATEKTYTIQESDAGYIIKVKATYGSETVWSGDSVAVGNILSSFSVPKATAFSVKKYANASTSSSFELGAYKEDVSSGWADKMRNSNNADLYDNQATGNAATTDGGYSYNNSGDNYLYVAEYTLATPVVLENVLVETGYGNGATAVPCVMVKVMYEGESTYKNWANYTDSFATAATMNTTENKYTRIWLLNVTGDDALIGVDTGKKVEKIQVIPYTLKDSSANKCDSVCIREISGFAKAIVPEIISIDSSIGAKVVDDTVSYVKSGTTAAQLINAITTNEAGMTVKVLSADKTTEIDAATALTDGMFVELISSTGTKTYYEVALSGTLRYVDINKDNGLNVGNVIEAAPVFTASADESLVTYQWVRTKVETKSHSNGSANDSRYVAIKGATEKTYTITEADAGYILKVKATHDGVTVWSGDCVAVGNILSSFSKNSVASYTLTKYANSSTATELVLGAASEPESAAWAAKVNNSNNADYYTHVATGNSVIDGGYAYHNCGDNNLWVAEYTMQNPIYLGNILVETGYGVTHTAIPCVNVQVMYDGETTYKNWANHTDSFKTKAAMEADKFNRINMINVTGDSAMIGDDSDKKVSKIKVIVYTLKDSTNNRTDAIFLREISGFATTVSPAIKAIDEKLGAELEENVISNLIKGTTAKEVLDAITGNAVVTEKRIVDVAKVTAISDSAYVKDGMFVELSSAEGQKVYYEIAMKADIATNFNDYVGKKSYRVGSTVRGTGFPSGWAAVYSANPAEADGATQEHWDKATMYWEGVMDSIKGNGVGKLHNSSTTITKDAGFMLTRNLTPKDTIGQVVVIETSVKAGDKNSNKSLNTWIGGTTANVPHVVDMKTDGKLYIAGTEIGNYDVDTWYNVALVMDLKTRTMIGYLNGEKVVDKEYEYEGDVETTGISRMAYYMNTYQNNAIEAGDFYFDDYKIYVVKNADYADFAISKASADGVEISPAESIAYVVKNYKATAPTVEAYVASVSAILPEYSVSIYNADGTAVAANASVTEGMKLVLSKASDESAFRMYKIAFAEPWAPTFYDKADLTTPIKSIGNQQTVVATIDIGSATGTMIIALYDGEKLLDTSFGEKIGEGDSAQIKAEINMQAATKPEIRVFLWEGMDTLVPMTSKYTISK